MHSIHCYITPPRAMQVHSVKIADDINIKKKQQIKREVPHFRIQKEAGGERRVKLP